ncbi:MAG: hypothetical protein QF775_02275 [archaeon]|jgi:hypothetical protein|nr:hypothetical protein [Euryarchaeota archaeon]MDP6704288.1 hypothetical protein [archaeon]|tara:strand:+ start:2490 stop:2783 length:294 start_codon:yes stop_codon:yes gene_type:complete
MVYYYAPHWYTTHWILAVAPLFILFFGAFYLLGRKYFGGEQKINMLIAAMSASGAYYAVGSQTNIYRFLLFNGSMIADLAIAAAIIAGVYYILKIVV